MSHDFSQETLEAKKKLAYNPNLSEADKKDLFKYFCTLKSELGDRVSKDTEKVLLHLQREVEAYNSPNNSVENWYKKPVGIICLSVVAILIASSIFQFVIEAYFSSQM